MSAHPIRLRGFWQPSPTPDGGVRFCRKFGRPRLTDPRERVWLICEDCPESAVLSLNGTVIGRVTAAQRLAVEVTKTLAERNELCLAFAPLCGETLLLTEPGQNPGQILLEIYPPGEFPG
jgi:hypothetical protein